MADIYTISRILIGIIILSLAAASDWRTRRVSNVAWLVMGGLGMLLLAIQIYEMDYPYVTFLILPVIAILFFDIFWDREPMVSKGHLSPIPFILHIIALASAIYIILDVGLTREVIQLLSVPAMILVAELFFYVGLLHGGADAKALMALAVLFPFYPIVEGLPMIGYPAGLSGDVELLFPFSFLILMNAAIIQVIAVPLGLIVKNIARGDHGFPEMLLGYRMRTDDVEKKFVWPMEVVRDGEVVLMLFPKRDGNIKSELASLKEMGMDEIWVTPKVPFIIPMLLGFIFSIIVGNLILLIL